MTILICHEIWRQVTLVELHAFCEVEFDAEGVRLFNSHDAIFADLVDRIGDNFADRCIASRDRGNACDIALVVDFFGLTLQRFNDRSDSFFDAALERHRVRTGSNIAHAMSNHCLGENCRRRRAVTGNVVCLGCDLFYKLRTHVLEWIFEFDIFCHRYTVVGDRRCAELFVEHDISAFWSERYFDRIGQFVHACFECATRLFVEFKNLCHVFVPCTK